MNKYLFAFIVVIFTLVSLGFVFPNLYNSISWDWEDFWLGVPFGAVFMIIFMIVYFLNEHNLLPIIKSTYYFREQVEEALRGEDLTKK